MNAGVCQGKYRHDYKRRPWLQRVFDAVQRRLNERALRAEGIDQTFLLNREKSPPIPNGPLNEAFPRSVSCASRNSAGFKAVLAGIVNARRIPATVAWIPDFIIASHTKIPMMAYTAHERTPRRFARNEIAIPSKSCYQAAKGEGSRVKDSDD